jgi:hypothetical protein
LAVAATAPEIALCDHEGCSKPAKFSYTWEWGASGKCCETHQFVLNQTAGNISRQINFVPLDSGIAPPIQRDERIAMHARALTLEAELQEGQLRGLELYNQNTQLTAQVQSLTVGKRELEAQLEAARRDLQTLGAELSDEAGRLRTLVRREPPPGAVDLLEAELRTTRLELSNTRAELNELLEGATAPGSERSSVGLGPADAAKE